MNNYKVLSKIGQGGMGQVYKALDPLGRTVALKTISSTMQRNKIYAKRFFTEAKAIALLQHPNIVSIYEFGNENDGLYISMEYVEGDTLANLLQQKKLSTRQSLNIFEQILMAMSYMHRKGIIHRDLKPSNIMIDSEMKPRIMDFGLAKIVDYDNKLTQPGEMLGTLAYMPPEQLQGQSIDHRSDLYSLGVILYEICTGTNPFQGKSSAQTITKIVRDTPLLPSSIKKNIPKYLDSICLKAISKDKKNRYQSARRFAKELSAAKMKKTSSSTGYIKIFAFVLIISISIFISLLKNNSTTIQKDNSTAQKKSSTKTQKQQREKRPKERKALSFFEKSLSAFSRYKYEDSLYFLQKAIKILPENPTFQMQLAKMYFLGKGCQKNKLECARLTKKYLPLLQNDNNSLTYYTLGSTYYYGVGIERNVSEAQKWFKKGAHLGSDKCYFQLAKIYQEELHKLRDIIDQGINKKHRAAFLLSAKLHSNNNRYDLARHNLQKVTDKKYVADHCIQFANECETENQDAIVFFVDYALEFFPTVAFYNVVKAKYMKKGKGYPKDENTARLLIKNVLNPLRVEANSGNPYIITELAWAIEHDDFQSSERYTIASKEYYRAIKNSEWIDEAPYGQLISLNWGMTNLLYLNGQKALADEKFRILLSYLNDSLPYNRNFSLRIALMYFNGLAVQKNVAKAIDLWENIVDTNPTAAIYLGLVYGLGDEVPYNPQKANYFFSKVKHHSQKSRVSYEQMQIEILHSSYGDKWLQYLDSLEGKQDRYAKLIKLFITGKKHMHLGNLDEAQKSFLKILAFEKQVLRRISRSHFMIPAMHELAITYYEKGDKNRALKIIYQAMTLSRQAGDLFITSPSLLKKSEKLFKKFR